MTAEAIGDSSWYAERLPGVQPLAEALDGLPDGVRRVVMRSGTLRGIALFVLGRRRSAVVLTSSEPGTRICVLLSALAGRKNVVLLEYIVHPPAAAERNVNSYLRRADFAIVRRWAGRRAVRWAHVLAPDDMRSYPEVHRFPSDHFKLIQWPSRSPAESEFAPLTATRRVAATGRRVDWQTFFGAAAGADWDVHVVCGGEDRQLVDELARQCGDRVSVRSEISAEEHAAEVRAADVYVIPVSDTGTSIGQIRVMNAIDAGVPIVASDVVGLRGYLDDSTARLVPAGDPTALRIAVDELLHAPDERDRLRRAARTSATTTFDDYLADIALQVAHVRPA